MKNGIPLVKCTANKSSFNSIGDRNRHILANTAKAMKAVTTRLGNMLSKIVS